MKKFIMGLMLGIGLTAAIVCAQSNPFDLQKIIPQVGKGLENKLIFTYDSGEIVGADIEYDIGFIDGGAFIKTAYGNIPFVKSPGPGEYDFDVFINSLGGESVVRTKIRNAAKAAIGQP